MAASAIGTARATRRVVTALQPVQTRSLSRASILGTAEALLGAGVVERGLSADRAHPRRAHPRPDRAAAAGRFEGDAVTGTSGGGQTGNSVTPPGTQSPATVPPAGAAPVARVRVPPAEVPVTPPTILSRDLPEVQVATPEVAVELPRELTTAPRR